MKFHSKKKLAFATTLVLALSTVLAACGSNDKGNSAPSGTSEASSSGGSGSPTIVNWWTWQPAPEQAQRVTDAFNASHDDVRIEFKSMQYNDYVNALKLAVISNANDAPDIIALQAGSMLNFYDEYLEDLSPLAESAWGTEWEDRYVELGLKQLQSGERTTALPYFVSATGYLWYNKTIFDEHGLQPPTNLEEWKQVNSVLSAAGITPFIQGAKEAWIDQDTFIVLANQFGEGKIYQAEAGEIPWTDPSLVQAMAAWKTMFDEGIMQKGALGIAHYPDAYDKFAKGEAAMIYNGTWNNSHMTRTSIEDHKKKYGIDKEYEVVPVLFPDMTGTGAKSKLFGGPDVAFGMYKNSKNKEAAWKVLEWFSLAESQTINAKNGKNPAIKEVPLDDSDVLTDFQKQALKLQSEQMNDVSGKREFLYPELGTALKDALDRVATGDKTPEQAMQLVQEAFDKIKK